MWNLDLRINKPCAFDENLRNIYRGDYTEEIYDYTEFLCFHKQFNNRSDYIDWLKPLYDSLHGIDYGISIGILQDLIIALKNHPNCESMSGLIENEGDVAYDLYYKADYVQT